MMMHGGDGDGGCVELQIGGQQLVHGVKNGNCVFCRSFVGAGRVRLDGGDQGDTQARSFELAVDAQVVSAKGSGPGNGNSQGGLAHCCGIQPCGARISGSGPRTA